MKRRRPMTMILPIAQDELEDRVLAQHPEAVRRRKEAQSRIAAGDLATAADLRALLRRTKSATTER